MSRVPLRLRLTAAFAVAMALALAAAALVVHVRVADGLDEAVDEALAARLDAVSAAVRDAGPLALETVAEDPDERFTLVVGARARVLGRSGGARGPVLRSGELARASAGPVEAERRVPGIEGVARLRAGPVERRARQVVVAVGQSLEDRDETLAGLRGAFLLGGPLAILLASLLGLAIAAAGLRPVDAIRRRAAEIAPGEDARVPVPAARDELRRLGETLNELLARVHRSFERERRFVADASHELRTPVAVIKAELEAAMRSPDTGPRTRESLVAALEECDRLAQLAEDLLVLARAGEDGLPVRPEPLDALALLEDAARRFGERAGARGRALAVDAPPGLVLHADPQRLRQALGNLVDNALRHGAGTVALSARADGVVVALRVADEGQGFDAAVAERAFERFTRGDDARTRGGAGLGLALVRAIAEAHGGRASLAEAPGGGGAAVRLELPRR